MPSTVVLQANGLNFQPNNLSTPPGSMTEASNVIIKREGVVESRRGFVLDGISFGASNNRLKQLISYKNKLLRHYGTTLQFEDGTTNDGTRNFTSFNGSYTEPTAGIRTKSIEANGNLFFTTNDGIKKISSKDGTDFSSASGYIKGAGGVKAIDFTADIKYTDGAETGFLSQDSTVAYRVVLGYKDANQNLILGAPSQRVELYNPLTTLLLRDLARVLGALDDVNQSGSLVTDGNYVSLLLLSRNGTASDLQTNILTLASKIDNDLLLGNDTGTGAPLTISAVNIASNVATVTFSGTGNPTNYLSLGSHIYVTGMVDSASKSMTGQYTLTGVTSTTITFTTSGFAAGAGAITSSSINSAEFRNIITTGSVAFPTSLTALIIDTPATHNQIATIQDTLGRMIVELQGLNTNYISSTLMSSYITPLATTSTATVNITISIPQGIDDNYFVQVYRSDISIATGTTVLTDLTADDEMALVYEAFPTAAELSALSMSFEDITPDAFRGTFLYTNAATADGINQENDVPPLAQDINRFKNVMFYANTKTRQRLSVSLLGVSNMISDYGLGITPALVISNGTTTNTYKFVTGVDQVCDITAVADTANSLNGTYFLVYNANNKTKYYVWYKTSGGTASDPLVAGATGIKVTIATGDTAANVATKTVNTVAREIIDFTTTIKPTTTTTIRITCNDPGYTNSIAAGTSGFTSPTVSTAGRGERASTQEVLLSNNISPAQAVDATARSLVRVVNYNTLDIVYLYYLSGSSQVPGQMLIEGRTLSVTSFYVLGNNSNTGASFNPTFSPLLTVSSITVGNSSTNLITTSTNHGLSDQDQVVLNIKQSSTATGANGLWTITYVSATTFRINTTIGGTNDIGGGSAAIRVVDAEVSNNETQPHRIYYSKINQPEAVPSLNYFDVGAQDKAILRIFPLRDSLFVFKEDGLYRVSGEVSPFTTSLFDSSFNLLAPDSLVVCNNLLYGWSPQGISTISESGTTPALSRPIDTVILSLSTSQYANFKTATFGIGYESDNSYVVFTVKNTTDTVATIAYRYSNLTNTWTTYDKTNTCGVIHTDDKLYLGAGDTNYHEQERKAFTRYDYADRQYDFTLTAGQYFGTKLIVSSVSNLAPGDVLVQDQTVTVYDYNMLLKQLDTDIGLNVHNFYSTLAAKAGDDMRAKIIALAQKLDTVTGGSHNFASSIASLTGTINAISIANPTKLTNTTTHGLITGRYVLLSSSNSTPSVDGKQQVTVTSSTQFTVPVNVKTAGTTATWATDDSDFDDLKICYNQIVNTLNGISGLYHDYVLLTNDTVQEAIISSVDSSTSSIILNNQLDYIVGKFTVYKAINCQFTYSPQTMGDPLGLKHLRESTIMFENKAFTNATLNFATDLLPAFVSVPFNGDGNGIFGISKFGTGLFGGGSNSAPLRTLIPRDCQRCRFIRVQFNHNVAREQFAIFGITVTGEVQQSSRAYR